MFVRPHVDIHSLLPPAAIAPSPRHLSKKSPAECCHVPWLRLPHRLTAFRRSHLSSAVVFPGLCVDIRSLLPSAAIAQPPHRLHRSRGHGSGFTVLASWFWLHGSAVTVLDL